MKARTRQTSLATESISKVRFIPVADVHRSRVMQPSAKTCREQVQQIDRVYWERYCRILASSWRGLYGFAT
jgi:hypothetical protein